jgi:hypothetical protein
MAVQSGRFQLADTGNNLYLSCTKPCDACTENLSLATSLCVCCPVVGLRCFYLFIPLVSTSSYSQLGCSQLLKKSPSTRRLHERFLPVLVSRLTSCTALAALLCHIVTQRLHSTVPAPCQNTHQTVNYMQPYLHPAHNLACHAVLWWGLSPAGDVVHRRHGFACFVCRHDSPSSIP